MQCSLTIIYQHFNGSTALDYNCNSILKFKKSEDKLKDTCKSEAIAMEIRNVPTKLKVQMIILELIQIVNKRETGKICKKK